MISASKLDSGRKGKLSLMRGCERELYFVVWACFKRKRGAIFNP
jgi:hypothetical protein